jgi:hypothetical protein
MGMYEGRGQLGKAMKELLQRWSATKGEWDDHTTHHFEQKFMHPLELDLRRAVSAMDHAAQFLQQLHRDCD